MISNIQPKKANERKIMLTIDYSNLCWNVN